MQDAVARDIAFTIHAGQRGRDGRLILEHLAQVAGAVPPDARPAAWLHHAAGDLPDLGLSAVELEALDLLARGPAEPYELYVLRIAYAWGDAGRLARTVKLADLDDRLAHDVAGSATPPYAWARRRIAVAHAQQLAVRVDDVAATG